MLHLIKLARAILNANQLEESILSSGNPKLKDSKDRASSYTEEEQRKSEESVPFGDKIDFSSEPTTEYLD